MKFKCCKRENVKINLNNPPVLCCVLSFSQVIVVGFSDC